MSISKDKLYVFVKGNRGIGAFLITGADFKEIHKDTVVRDSDVHQLYMDLYAMEESLKYIIQHRGKGQIPIRPVVCIYTTFENNYEIMSLKEPKEEDMKKIRKKLASLGNTINANRKHIDGVKYYWVPDAFEMHFDDLEQLLLERKNEAKIKPR